MQKARDRHLETVVTLVKGSWSWTIGPESWGRGLCPISRAPGATADLAGCIGQWTLQGPALHGKPLPLGA